MGVTFFEDEEIFDFVNREMEGVILLDEPTTGLALNQLEKSLKFEDEKFTQATESTPLINKLSGLWTNKSSSLKEQRETNRPSPLAKHLHERFVLGFFEEPKYRLYQSNVMKFANDNSQNIYRYYRKFLEQPENIWMDAELFEKALAGWMAPNNLRFEALERLETAYSNFKAETDHLSHEYNLRVYDINRRFEARFENLRRILDHQNYADMKKSYDEIDDLMGSINEEMPALFEEQRNALDDVIYRNETAKEKLQVYFSKTMETMLSQSKDKNKDDDLAKNSFAVRRIKEHAKAISFSKQAVRKAFD
jgi:hypothetical protein